MKSLIKTLDRIIYSLLRKIEITCEISFKSKISNFYNCYKDYLFYKLIIKYKVSDEKDFNGNLTWIRIYHPLWLLNP